MTADTPHVTPPRPAGTPEPGHDLKSAPMPELEEELGYSPDGLSSAEATPVQRFALGKGIGHAIADGVAPGPHDKDYFQLFPNFFILGSPVQPFSHMVMPISASRTRGVIRFYWKGDDQRASQRFAREYSWALGRDIHAEEDSLLVARQAGERRATESTAAVIIFGALTAALLAWRYKPYQIGGEAVPVCGIVTFIYEIK